MPVEALRDIKALTFDVFGTVVNWRESVESALKTSIQSKSKSKTSDPDLQHRAGALTDADYANLAQQWRNSYKHFTHSFQAGTTPWKDIDTHHHDSLVALLEQWRLAGLYTPSEAKQLSLVWHRLRPWPDSAGGIHQLAALGLAASTLSNGNRSLLADLDSSGGLGFSRLLSAEDFGAYKPDPKVYLGAAERLGVRPGEVAMVAAHLNDLDAARQLGLRTIYVERAGEEDWSVDDERYRAAKEWVDLWIGLDEEGFVEVARRLKDL
ncbi:(S)-2-haloacid dehalogenase 1 [Cytospora mali]|uniref:(S)-2-haloacid dehalogenase 1 n=1 Tax=Cytospora mali TaxID=578113 RepID=A0A194WDR3_CYTMA|nr:(S)-2-haloacid dehalogenase 1 [Valsa mali]